MWMPRSGARAAARCTARRGMGTRPVWRLEWGWGGVGWGGVGVGLQPEALAEGARLFFDYCPALIRGHLVIAP